MKAGIVGFTGAGRRTLFRLLTRAAGAETGRGPQLGMFKIPDPRLEELARLHRSRKITPATMEFVMIPGLVKGEAQEALDLPAFRNVEVLAHVVRAFEDPSVPHPEGSVDAARDLELMELELCLSDLGVVERRLERLRADAGKGKKADPNEIALLERAREKLSNDVPLRAVLSAAEQQRLRGYALLSAKPLLLVVNVGEADAARKDLVEALALGTWVAAPAVRLAFVSARIEAEIRELPPDEAEVFREDLGLLEDTHERIVRAAFDLLDVIVFYTAADVEARAWVIPRGTPAAAAAGTIHTDMERGFIRAEVVGYDVLVREGSWNACREKGLLRLEGKDYEIRDGDVVYFRFSV